MKRLLLISYSFPPQPSAGALRPGYLARYLPEFGWEPTVLTHSPLQPPFDVRVASTNDGSPALTERVRGSLPQNKATAQLRRAFSSGREALLFPDHVAPWIPKAISTGTQLVREAPFDAILGTALPASVHVVGAALAERSGAPWIADYRDPWFGNAYVRRGVIRKRLERAAELRLLRRAAALTTISEPIAEHLRDFHKRRDVYVIPNAYDPAEWSGIDPALPERFELCYTGSMYDGKRSPDLLFAAMSELAREGHPAGAQAHVSFYGRNSSNVAVSAQSFGVTAQVEDFGMVPRAQAMRAQRGSAAVLLFLNMDESTAHEMGSKYLEYIGARRPILAFGPSTSVMRDFIERNDLGWFASDVAQAKRALAEAYARFTDGTYDAEHVCAEIPTARDLARRFAEVLDAAAPGTRAKAS